MDFEGDGVVVNFSPTFKGHPGFGIVGEDSIVIVVENSEELRSHWRFSVRELKILPGISLGS